MVSLHSAYHDATPMVMLVGQVERGDFGRLALQEQNYSRLLSDVTKQVIEVNEPEQASEAIARAFHLAESGTPGPVAVILPEDIFDEETDAETDMPRPHVVAGPRAEDLEWLAEMLAKAERPLVLVGGALMADAVRDKAALRRSEPARRGMGIADQPDASPAAAVRRDASELRRLYGDPRAARADRRDEKGRSDGRARRAHDRHGQPVLHASRRRRQPQLPFVHVWPDANEVGRVWRPDLGIPASPHEVIKALLQRGAPARRREAPGLGRRAQRDPPQAAGEGMGADHATASISRRSSARSTSTWRRTRR